VGVGRACGELKATGILAIGKLGEGVFKSVDMGEFVRTPSFESLVPLGESLACSICCLLLLYLLFWNQIFT